MAPTVLKAGDDGEGCLAVYPLRTDRLLLRPMTLAHVSDMVNLLNDPEVSRHTARIPYPYTYADGERFVAETLKNRAAGVAITVAVERRSDGALVGVADLVRDGADGQRWELGYWIARACWGQGFGREAVAALVTHARRDVNISVITASVVPENTASLRLLASLGFTDIVGDDHFPTPARCAGFSAVKILKLDHAGFSRATHRPTVLVSAAALIDTDGRVLLAQRPEGKAMAGLWEFPGGKVEHGETPEQALIRELTEELMIDVRESCLAPLTFASHAYPTFHLLMPLYICRTWRGTPTPREGQTLQWVRAARLGDYPMPPADVPLVAILRDWLE